LGKLYRYAIIGLSAILLGAVAMSMYYYLSIASYDNIAGFAAEPARERHRVSLIINNSDTLYWQIFKKGAMDAAAEHNIAIEFHGIEDARDLEATKRQMQIAVASQKDGIIINALDEVTFEEDIGNLVQNGITVVTTGVEGGKDTYFVGTNAFEYGQKAARLVIEAVGENARVAIILDNTVDEIVGFSKELQQYDDAVIETIEKTDGHLIGAVDVIQTILTDYPQVNAIFCMSPEDTLAAAQAVVDRNLVGDVVVVGTDLSDTPTVRQYIERNIIFGYIERNPYDAGFQSVTVLSEVLDGEFKPTFITIDPEMITRLNLGRY